MIWWRKKNGFLGLNPSFGPKKHTLLSSNHVLATTGKSFANKQVPFSRINISLLADPVKISKFSSGKARRQAKGVALLPMAYFSCDGPISTSLFDFGTSMCKLLSGRAVLLSINILADFQAEAPTYPSRCWRRYSTSLLQKFPSFLCNFHPFCGNFRPFCLILRHIWSFSENIPLL